MIKHLCKLLWNRKRINFLITVEIFFSFLVIFAVIVFAVYYIDNYRQPLGFKYENVWYIGVHRRAALGDRDRPQHMATSRQLLAALRDFSEIECAAGAEFGPYSNGSSTYARQDSKTGVDIKYEGNAATDDLKEVLGLKVVRGRWFGKEDDGASYRPVVINRRLARDRFGDEDPIGQDMTYPTDRNDHDSDGTPFPAERVVGVIDDLRKRGEFDQLRGYLIYRNDLIGSQAQPPGSFLIKVRPGTTAAFEEKLLARLQAEARDWSFNIKTLAEMRESVFQEYLAPMAVFSLIGGFLLIMVGLGLTGVLWLNVTQRTKEIGLRRAKGATRSKIYKQILAELFIIASFGLLIGLLVVVQFPLLNFLGFASIKVYTVSIVISLVLIYMLTAACALYPSWLATKVRPAEALHYE